MKKSTEIMRMRITAITCLLLFVTAMSFAQEETTQDEQEKPNTIDQQFSDLINDSNNFQEYKVVKKFAINKLQENTKDSIANLKSQIDALQGQLATQKEEVNKLNSSLSSTQQTLDTTREEKDSINFLGIQMTKSGYKSLMWGIVAVLGLALLFFVYKFKGSNSQTQEANKKLNEVEFEYEEYRKKALEKEQKMGRLLQDERNKIVKNSKG